ncbi:MAG: hypothetical protein GTN94_40615 [Candidatus Aminicenantes bacterium]|nr:hypothetical protein [Candidatus Aminicenantes bacterium]
MSSYHSYTTISIEEKTAAKEKNKRLLKEYFSPLAAKINQKFLQMFHVQGHASCFFKKSPWPPEANP